MVETIDVVIPAYNAERFLARALDSVLSLARNGLRAIVVDDGSSDGTAAIARRFVASAPTRCVLVESPRNEGVSAARNRGIEASDAAWIAFLDADDYFLPVRFDALDRLPAEHRVAVEALYESTQIVAEVDDSLDGGHADPTLFGILVDASGPTLLEELLTGRCWATSAITIRRSVFARCGVFDPTRKIAEDCHLWFRLAAMCAVRAGSLATPVSAYARHGGNTFSPRIEHRIPMLDAMLDAWQYAAAHEASSAALATFASAVPAYALRSIIAAREAGSPAVASALWRRLIRARPLQLFSPPILRQAIALLRGRSPVAAASATSGARR